MKIEIVKNIDINIEDITDNVEYLILTASFSEEIDLEHIIKEILRNYINDEYKITNIEKNKIVNAVINNLTFKFEKLKACLNK